MKSIKIDRIQHIIKTSCLKGFDITIWEHNKHLELVHIKIPSVLRGQGIGSMIMNELCVYADNRRLPIHLEVVKTSYRTISLYKRFGFKEDKVNERDLLEMIRN